MTEDLHVRVRLPDDFSAIARLYPHAFPEEDLLPLVTDLLREATGVLSLVGIIDATLVGHGLFTECQVSGERARCALLGPLAVAPARQRQGIGSALVRDGLRRLEDAGVSHVYVLGDPAYYGRLGFAPESRVVPPYALPSEWTGAWQSLHLGGAASSPEGMLSVPTPWLQPRLWGP